MESLESILLSDDIKKLIYKISNKFYDKNKKDLYQVGYIGVIKAYKNYLIESNVKFTTFAYKYIFGEMYEYVKNNRNIKLNKNYLSIYKKIETTKNLLTQKFNKEPSISEISTYLEMDVNLINDVIISSKKILSLDNIIDESNECNLYTYLGKTIDYDTNILIRDSLEVLNDKELEVIKMKYFKDYTQQEIADILGVNQVKVSRIELKAKKKIKEYLCA